MKKYRVSGTGVHAIKLVECETKPKKSKCVTWFDNLDNAKEQVLKNQRTEVRRLIEEKSSAERLKVRIEERIAIMSKPLDLDVITDDFLIRANARMEELSDKIQRGENVF